MTNDILLSQIFCYFLGLTMGYTLKIYIDFLNKTKKEKTQ